MTEAVFRAQAVTKTYQMGDVLEGLNETDQVIVYPSDLIKDGVAVEGKMH
jgi:hypothetical protein